MTKIAFFGHDAADAAVRRRAHAFQADGLALSGFMMRRGEAGETAWPNTDLGQTRDGAFRQRIAAVLAGARKAAEPAAGLAEADLIYARNLDMLACAFLAKRHAKLDTPVVYECLDVHRLLTRRDALGAGMRALERSLLKRCRALVVSSPGFLKNHFEPRHAGLYKAALLENRMAAGDAYGPRPTEAVSPKSGALTIGWVGVLRCQRSFHALLSLADAYPDTVEIRLHGAPARTEIPVFEPEIERRANVSYAGRYRAPADLAAVYTGCDLVWAGDYMEAGFNSVWLLPNRLYEGGYYAVPPIAPAGTETAAWIEARSAGFVIEAPIETSLPALAARLLQDPSPVRAASQALLARPETDFIQPKGVLADLVSSVLDERAAA